MRSKNRVAEPEKAAATHHMGAQATATFADHRNTTATQRRLINHIADAQQRTPVQQVKQLAEAGTVPLQERFDIASLPNKTGMPNQLKAGIESLSGMDLSDVRVHRNASQPAQLNAHAFAQGNDIHMGPGQEQHLPHEAWHGVQQRQGWVKPTMQMAGTQINDDASLEKEADVMGTRALGLGVAQKQAKERSASANHHSGLLRVAQLAPDMSVAKENLIHRIRQDVSAALWTGDATNSEVQVGLEGTVATVGWNVGGNGGVNQPPSVGNVNNTLATLLTNRAAAYNGILGNAPAVTEIKVIKTKANNPAKVDGRTLHAEGIIIAERIKGLLTKITNKEEIRPTTLSVFGKKAACVQCGNTISRLNAYPGVWRFLTIQTASDVTFATATGGNATHGNQGAKWINPLHLIKDDIKQAAEFVRKNVSPGAPEAGLNYDHLLYFLHRLETEAARDNPG